MSLDRCVQIVQFFLLNPAVHFASVVKEVRAVIVAASKYSPVQVKEKAALKRNQSLGSATWPRGYLTFHANFNCNEMLMQYLSC